MNNSVPFYGKGLPCLSIHQWWTVGVFFFNLVMSQALPFNNSADFCVNECFQFLWYITRLKCLGYMITWQFLFWSALKCFSRLYSMKTLSKHMRIPIFFILIILIAFLAIILNTVKCYFTVTVIWISLIVNYRAHCFQYLLASCASPIEEWLFPSSGHY